MQGLMVVLDNRVSRPQWCCTDRDGNGFWGDEYFDIASWLRGLNALASSFTANPLVVAISLRSELRGPRQNSIDWQVLISQAAEAVHDINPNILLIANGLTRGTDLSFLSNNTLDTSRFQNKLVYGFHWYESGDFRNDSRCARAQKDVMEKSGFLIEQGAPLMLSEFGMNLNSPNVAENRFIDCVIEYLQQEDLDWSFWALQGSYYLRDDEEDADEAYGLLSPSWQTFRNPNIVARLQITIKMPPKVSMHHPDQKPLQWAVLLN